MEEGRSLAETPTYLVAAVITVIVVMSFFFEGSMEWAGKGKEPLVSHETLKQLHRLMFVLAFIHVSYSHISIALALTKIYSWRMWENQAKSMAKLEEQGKTKVVRFSSFIFHHTSHSWNQRGVLVWLLCFSRQFWGSINRVDYMALRMGFISTHGLPLSYDFHSYMLRSMDEEFKDIVGIRYHTLETYKILIELILLLGMKLRRVVVKLAVERKDPCPVTGKHFFKLRDDLFWFGRPRLLLHLIRIISFQWEIRNSSCFMDSKSFMVTRLTFGVASQCWCSYVTFPLYLIVTQMGSRFKKSIVSQDVRRSLSVWQQRARSRQKPQDSTAKHLSMRSATSPDLLWGKLHSIIKGRRRCTSLSRVHDDSSVPCQSDDIPPDKRSYKSLEELVEEDIPSQFPSPSSSFTSYEEYDHRTSIGVTDDSYLLTHP
ncbi:hypothetical protein CRG98_011402 [Punica granatum]|uniref:MLO-like protein n=1 Tax=Punica granatum TaxID=22663 RepID=A0A2I0KJ37_PUNGR|nr:hypothetical protein CRG98_011402 [Punica granatum]